MKISILLLGLALSSGGCGPVNAKKSGAQDRQRSSCNGVQGCDAQATAAYSLSSGKKFLSRIEFKSPQPGQLNPKVGDSQFLIRYVREGLDPVGKEEVTIQYYRQKTTGTVVDAAKYDAKIEKADAAAGSLATLTFKKPGIWMMNVRLSDGEVQDDVPFTIKVDQ